MQLAREEMSVLCGMEISKALPPTIWWRCGEGREPGLTRGSIRSITSWWQPKRSMVDETFGPQGEVPSWGAARPRVERRDRRRNIVVARSVEYRSVKLGRAVSGGRL